MRIVVFGLRGFPGVQGGIEKHCEEVYPRLVELGAEVTVIARKKYMKKDLKAYKGVKFVNIYSFNNKFLENISHSFFALFLLRKLKPDIVHIHSIGSSLVIPLARLISNNKYKIVMTNHGPDYLRKKWNPFAKYMLKQGEKNAVRYSDAMICISKWITDYIKEKYNKSSYFIPNGITIREYGKNNENKGNNYDDNIDDINNAGRPGKISNKFGIENKYILAVTRFVPEKGVTDLINAYNLIGMKNSKDSGNSKDSKDYAYSGDSDNPLNLVIVGKADHASEYSRNIRELSKGIKGVVLTGALYEKDLYDMYANASLFVLPSYYEGLPIVLLEALSFGVPVLVSDIKAHRELNLPEFRYFKTGNISDLSIKITECLKIGIDEDEKIKYLNYIKSNYDWNDIAVKTLDVYKSVTR